MTGRVREERSAAFLQQSKSPSLHFVAEAFNEG